MSQSCLKAETENNSKYLIEDSDEVIRPLVLILPKMSWYINTFKNEGGDKNNNDSLMSLSIDDDNILQKYQTISTTDLRNNE